MVDGRIKSLVDKVLNDVGVPRDNGDDVMYYCPFCHHRKRKFEVNLNTEHSSFGKYGCWVCKHRNPSHGLKLITLFRKLNAKPEYVQELKSLLQSKKLGNFDKINQNDNKYNINICSLPDEYFPLYNERNTPDYKNALHYAKKRGCTLNDIIRYNIGYCESGEYSGKLIIPSYDAFGNLNFFSGRDFYDSDFNKHKNPNWSKDIIGFELFINWKLPLTLVEGPMDAIAVKRNVIPLFGKNISETLIKKILTEKVTDIYIALDPDAIRDLIPIAEMFIGYGINTYIVSMPDGYDPNKLGYIEFMKIKNNTKKATFRDLVQYKLGF